MSIPFSAVVTPTSVAFSDPSGKTFNITNAHGQFERIREIIKDIQTAYREGRTEDAEALRDDLRSVADPVRVITVAGKGVVTVVGGNVLYKGERIDNAITQRIVWGIGEGADMASYIAFLENLMLNPSKRSVDQLYGFLEKNQMGITDDGHILAYKRVRDNFTDVYTGTIDNSPGKIVSMDRNKVNDDPQQTCSSGLHFCSQSYLPHFGNDTGNRIVIVKVNPRDVVCIPYDYNHAKVRCCLYEVIGEYTADDKHDLLTTKAVWTGRDMHDAGFNNDWSEDPDHIEDDDFDGDQEWLARVEEEEDDDQDDPYNWPDLDIDIVTYVLDSSEEPISAEIVWENGDTTNVLEENLDELQERISGQMYTRKAKIRIKRV
jgi:hypothetical protein